MKHSIDNYCIENRVRMCENCDQYFSLSIEEFNKHAGISIKPFFCGCHEENDEEIKETFALPERCAPMEV